MDLIQHNKSSHLRSVFHCLSGMSYEVRERCVIELALYSAYYLADEKLVNRIAALRALQFKRDF